MGARVLFARPGLGVAATQHRTDPRLGLGNMLAGRAVALAMCETFRQSSGDDLCDRLLAALGAGEREGGESGVDGLRSAALLVVGHESFPFVDLRIDDDPEPLPRLSALWQTSRPLAVQFVARALTPDDVHRSSSTTT